MAKKNVYFFGIDKTDGDKNMKDILGGKGANLAEMAGIGLPVPPGFTVSTEVCNTFAKLGNKIPPEVKEEILRNIKKLEGATKQIFGGDENPLLVSVRSGAKFSMPGMMDTVLNLGLNDKTLEILAKKTGNRRFALDCYRRLIHMFGDVVLEIPKKKFEDILKKKKEQKKVALDHELTEEALEELITDYRNLIKKETKKDFPQDVKEQLLMSISAVFESWNNPRAVTYRRLNYIPDDLGTAVNVQQMVFGNIGEKSATGVGFTRNPASGERELYGEYLFNAQGEDVVAGVRTPSPLKSLEKEMPAAYKELKHITSRLEKHYRDVQDFEFTVQESKLYMLQTRNGKRTGQAAVKIAVDMVEEGLVSKEQALMMVEPDALNQLLHPVFDAAEKVKFQVLAKGLAASPGAAAGQVVFTADEAVAWEKKGRKVLLVRDETSPDDIHGMSASQGILTATGGMTSHAAVVGRQMGKPAVVGCGDIRPDEERKLFLAGDIKVKEGDWISIDGTLGEVLLGQIPTQPSEIIQVITGEKKSEKSEIFHDFTKLLYWADHVKKLWIRANTDTPEDARIALALGAEGIGLARTEDLMVELAVLKASKGKQEKIKEAEKLLERVKALSEFNPMLGHRGCRLGISYPEIIEMQATAIFEAVCQLAQEQEKVYPEIMIPLVGIKEELSNQKKIIQQVAARVMDEYKVKVEYSIGTMIEIPRAAITADQIAEEAEFFSFGTNDLTQTIYGLSRDDGAGFLAYYLAHGIWKNNPFETVDVNGVGELMKMAVEKGRKTKPNLKIGICGVHGGDPRSIFFCHKIGLNYVSCSAYQIPIARLAAAQVTLMENA
jgi:pyruvate,orthophosphate dikinase